MFILNKLCVGKQLYVNGGIPQLLFTPLDALESRVSLVVADYASFILVKRKLRLSSRLKLCCQLIIADTPRASASANLPANNFNSCHKLQV